jgi:hypothetical protein
MCIHKCTITKIDDDFDEDDLITSIVWKTHNNNPILMRVDIMLL